MDVNGVGHSARTGDVGAGRVEKGMCVMTVSNSALPARRRRRTVDAIILPSREWRSPVVDAAKVNRELNELWAELGQVAVPAEIAPGGDGLSTSSPAARDMDAPDVPSPAIVSRAATLNLVAVADSEDGAERVRRAVIGLPDFQPSRVIVLVAQSKASEQATGDLLIRVALLEQPPEKHRPAIRFECITVEADRTLAGDLASVVSPLLIAELGDFLWWPGDGVSRSAVFRNLAGVMDRVIVDTSSLSKVSRGMAALHALAGERNKCPFVSDFAWTRLTPWRQLIAQFFDPPIIRQCLETIEDVEIVYPSPDDNGVSGLSAALLFASWLANALNWELDGPSERARSGYRAVLRSGGFDSQPRQIVLRLRPDHNPIFGRALGAVTLTSRGHAPGSFSVERTTWTEMTTTSSITGEPHVGRMVHAVPATDSDLLAEEMHVFEPNPIYEQALALAVRLLPEDGVRM
jgi:glucose-6-phosphate dehydrogenase assembly protein OpcA